MLTERRVQILELLAQGKSQREIAGCLQISCSAVNKAITILMARLGAVNTANAVYLATKRQIIR